MALHNLISDSKYAKELQKQYVLEDSLAINSSSIELYCPYKKCSKLLIHYPSKGITKGKCPWCRGLLCVHCRVPWHIGRDCDKFQKEEKEREDESRLKWLAEDCNWKNCPRCNSLVDKVDGGIRITCRCKEEFCYACGKIWTERHWNCETR